jgi:hypothetical protein
LTLAPRLTNILNAGYYQAVFFATYRPFGGLDEILALAYADHVEVK